MNNHQTIEKLKQMRISAMAHFGLQAFDNHAREALLDIIDERFNDNSTIVCSQIPVSAWYDIIREGTIADAIQIIKSKIGDVGEWIRIVVVRNVLESFRIKIRNFKYDLSPDYDFPIAFLFFEYSQ